ncbi:MAG: cysteine hydrolase family protein, partial [Cellulosilyticaceae bacterium]
SISQQAGQSVFEKEIFGSTVLAETLQKQLGRGQGVRVELVGLCTDICVISNAMLLRSYMPEAEIVVDAKCCAGVTPKSHENALQAMKMCQIGIIND